MKKMETYDMNNFYPTNDDETVLLIDSWKDQESIDFHHASPMMVEIAKLRDKYDLHMCVERYVSDDTKRKYRPQIH